MLAYSRKKYYFCTNINNKYSVSYFRIVAKREKFLLTNNPEDCSCVCAQRRCTNLGLWAILTASRQKIRHICALFFVMRPF